MAERRVYIVDDEEPIRRATQLMLRAQGYDVGLFESGVALLDNFAALGPGCILLDVRMPQMDGLEVQRALQRLGSRHPVIVMTGHGDVTVAVQALQYGAAAFLDGHAADRVAFVRSASAAAGDDSEFPDLDAELRGGDGGDAGDGPLAELDFPGLDADAVLADLDPLRQ